MIVLNVSYQCKPGMRDEFLKRIISEGIDTASRGDTGNLKYDYYLPADGGDELLLVERWTDNDALRAHGLQPHLAKLTELKDDYVIHTSIERFDIPE